MLRITCRFASLAGLALAVAGFSGDRLSGQNSIFFSHGDSPGDEYGCVVAGLGDVNLDGYPDLLIGAPGADGDRGMARVVSGRDGRTLHTVTGLIAGGRLGDEVIDAGDVDRDGIDDFAIATRDEIRIYAGSNWKHLRTHRRAGVFAAVGDLDGDGHADLAVAYRNSTAPYGAVQVFSGRNGMVLRAWFGGDPTQLFGGSLAGIGDVDRDGHADVLIGAPSASGSGAAFVYSGFTAAELYAYHAGVNDYGFADNVSAVGDTNGDGHDDFAIAVIDSFPTLTKQPYVNVYSGADGLVLFTVRGQVDCYRSNCTFEYGLGKLIEPAGDLDGDAHADLLVLSDYGLRVVSGRTGTTVFQYPGEFVHATACHDIDLDGIPDFAVTHDEEVMAMSGGDRHRREQIQFCMWDGGLVDAGNIGDLDGDGHDDFALVTIGVNSLPIVLSSCRLYSGATGVPLDSVSYGSPFAVGLAAPAGDANNDSVPDFAVTWQDRQQPTNNEVLIYSGSDRSVLHRFTGRTHSYGLALAGGIDVDGDNYDDLAIGDVGEAPGGYVEIRSGRTGAVIRSYWSTDAGDSFGAALARAPDLTSDAHDDLLIGAPGYDGVAGVDSGRVYLVSGNGGNVLGNVEGWRAGDRFGSDVAGAGDLDRDGHGEFLVGAPRWLGDAGAIFVISGRSLRTLRVVQGEAGARLGFHIAGGGVDMDGDGVPDFAYTNPHDGSETVVSGATFAELQHFPGYEGALSRSVLLRPGATGRGKLVGIGPIGPGVDTGDCFGKRTGYAWVYQVAERGVLNTFGHGCLGRAGVPTLVGTGDAVVGGTITMRVSRLEPHAPGMLFFGLSSETYASLRLPFPLSYIGMEGCMFYTSVEAQFGLTSSGDGRVDYSFTVPDDPTLLGASLYSQYVSTAPGANTLGLTASNAGMLQVGI